MIVNTAAPLWDQVPKISDVSRSFSADGTYNELAAVAAAIINVKPDWIPGTVFQASTAHFRNGTNPDKPEYKPLMQVERDDMRKGHVPVLKLFANKNPIYLKDFMFYIVADTSRVFWHQALNAAFKHSEVQDRLGSNNPQYLGVLGLDPVDNMMHKIMAFMEMLTGETPQVLSKAEIPWEKNGEGKDYDAVTGFDSLAYTPTVLFGQGYWLGPLSRTPDKKAYDFPDLRKTSNPLDERVYMDLDEVASWAVRLKIENPAENNFNLLRVAPPDKLPDVDTDAYFDHFSSSPLVLNCGKSKSPYGRQAETIDPSVLINSETLLLWDQLPTRYDMAHTVRGNDEYTDLAAIAAAITNVKPDWIPGTIFQASASHFRNGTADKSDAYKPSILVEKDNHTQAHVAVLTLFPNKDPIFLEDYTFNIVPDGSKVVWHQALLAAYHEPVVQERLKTLDPQYTITGDSSEYFTVYKAMGIMEMLTGQKPDSRISNDFPWKSSGSAGGEYNAASGFDPLSYSPTILHTADKKTRPITRFNQDMYYLLDSRVLGPGESGTPVAYGDELLSLEDLTDETFWSIRLPFERLVNNDRTLLRVPPPCINTDAYFSKSANS